jgi:hypothetical protein
MLSPPRQRFGEGEGLAGLRVSEKQEGQYTSFQRHGRVRITRKACPPLILSSNSNVTAAQAQACGTVVRERAATFISALRMAQLVLERGADPRGACETPGTLWNWFPYCALRAFGRFDRRAREWQE